MASIEQLAQAHGFTLEQLALNRAGRFHPAQVARGRGAGTGWGVFFILLGVVALVAGIGGAALFYDDLRPPISRVDLNAVYALVGGGVFLALCFSAAAVATLVGVSRRRAIYDRGVPGVVEGAVEKVLIKTRRQRDTYAYRVAGRGFNVPHDGWMLVEGGARFRVYFVAEELLSLEPA